MLIESTNKYSIIWILLVASVLVNHFFSTLISDYAIQLVRESTSSSIIAFQFVDSILCLTLKLIVIGVFYNGC